MWKKKKTAKKRKYENINNAVLLALVIVTSKKVKIGIEEKKGKEIKAF